MNDTPPPSDATVHRWPARALIGDYLRAGAGFAVCFPPLLFIETTLPVGLVLGGLSGLFAWLGLRTLSRQRAVVQVDGQGIARGRRRLAWDGMTRVTLRRFGARRKGGGMMEMTLVGKGGRIGIDSDISEFIALARRVFDGARASGVTFDARTRDAFAALGITASRQEGPDQDARR